MCYKAEHIEHTVAGCTTLAPSEYTNRHNKMAGYIHWMICKRRGYRYCEHIPERVINVDGSTIMWDVPVITDRAILAN